MNNFMLSEVYFSANASFSFIHKSCFPALLCRWSVGSNVVIPLKF